MPSILARKWKKDSESQEYNYMKPRLYASISNALGALKDSDNFNNFCEYLKSIENGNDYNKPLSPLLKVSPLVFLNVHKFYNSDVVSTLEKYIPEVKDDKNLLETCFILYSILFFLYSNKDLENAIFSTKSVFESCVVEKIFEHTGLFEFITSDRLDVPFDKHNSAMILKTAIFCSRKAKKFGDIFEILDSNDWNGKDDLRKIVIAVSGFIFGFIDFNDLQDGDMLCSKNVSDFFEYCISLYK